MEWLLPRLNFTIGSVKAYEGFLVFQHENVQASRCQRLQSEALFTCTSVMPSVAKTWNTLKTQHPFNICMPDWLKVQTCGC